MIPHSELILNPDGSIYHLGLKPEDICRDIITVGDPDRVAHVAALCDKVLWTKSVREFVTAKAILGNKEVLIISTGIGTDNIDIVFNELDACVNIDFESRTIKNNFTPLRFYRIGTSGVLDPHIAVGSMLISTYAIGLDGLLRFYKMDYDDDLVTLARSAEESVPGLNISVSRADGQLVKHFEGQGFLKGITITAAGFYGPQGRQLRLEKNASNYLNNLAGIEHQGNKVTNLEMETAGIYGLASLLGHQAISLNALLANRKTGEFAKDPSQIVEDLIRKSLMVIAGI